RAARYRPAVGHQYPAAGDVRARHHQIGGHARRHLLRLAIRRLDPVDPHAHPRRSLLGDDLHRRLRGGAEKTRPRGRLPPPGRAGAALCIAAVGSWIAGTFGVLMLTLIAPPLATFALRFGPPEYTALLVLGLVFLAYMSSTSLPRTLLMACFGLLLGTIGIDNMTGHFRFSTFFGVDIPELGDGIGIVPVAVGLFGLGEILSTPSANVVGKVIAPK